jgi:hypothetical protein
MNTITCSIWDSDPGLPLTSARACCMAGGRAVTAPAAPITPMLLPTNCRRDRELTAHLHSLGSLCVLEPERPHAPTSATPGNVRSLDWRRRDVTQTNSRQAQRAAVMVLAAGRPRPPSGWEGRDGEVCGDPTGPLAGNGAAKPLARVRETMDPGSVMTPRFDLRSTSELVWLGSL